MDLLEATGDGGRHPWELARVRAARAILDDGLPAAPARVLDFGCGDAFAGLTLTAGWPQASLRAVDRHFTDAHLDRLRAQHPAVSFDRELDPAGDRAFDLVLLLDVLEHIADDRAVLRALAREQVAPGGHVLITVPAFPALYGPHDRFLRHERRYTRARLDEAIAGAGLEVRGRGYLFGSLLPARAMLSSIGALVGRLRGAPTDAGGARWSGGPLLTRALTGGLHLDNRLLLALSKRAVHLPGLSLWALCRRPR